MSIDAQGTKIQRGNGATPEVFTTIGEVSDWNGPDGSATVLKTTHLLSAAQEKRMGLADEGKIACSGNFMPSDAVQAALRSDRANRTLRNFKIIYSDNSSTDTFSAFVTKFATSGGVDAIAKFSLELEISGAVS